MTRNAFEDPYDDCEDEAADEDDAYALEDDDTESEILACPRCRGFVHEDTQQCPHCGDWIVPVDPREGTRRWIWAVAVALVITSMLLLSVL